MKTILSRYRVFILAIFLSFVWHIFWLSSIKIVSVPPKGEGVKFSKVSFLGPILERGPIDLRVQPKERMLLEKRYLKNVRSLTVRSSQEQEKSSIYVSSGDAGLSGDRTLVNFIDEALAGAGIEPSYGFE